VALKFAFFLFFSLGLFGLDGGSLVTALELAQGFNESPQPKEIESDLFKEIEQVDPETEHEIEEIKKETSDSNSVWIGVALLIGIKLVLLIWFE